MQFKMSSFSISKEELIDIVDRTQKRTFAEEIQVLETKRAPHDWLASGINTDFQTGIFGDNDDINERLQFYGTNRKPAKIPPGFFELLCEALEDFTMRILIVASLITIAVQVGTAEADERKTAWIEGFAILVAVFVSATVTAANDYQKERQFIKLNEEKEKKKVVTVYRNGKMEQIHQDYVLVGDVIQISGGMEVPADGIVIEANELVADESAMTGETKPIKKNTLPRCIEKKNELIKSGRKNQAGSHTLPSPVMLSGTSILSGEGKMVIIVVGELSCLGKIRSVLAQDEDGPTPLQNKLEKIAEDIGKFGLYSAILILIALLIRFGIEKGIEKNWDTSHDVMQLIEYFILALTVVVVAIPEGLPLAVTLSLAFSVKRMLLDNNLVRKLEACETMGGANNICSDKTGTLTKNEMTLTTYWNEKINQFPMHAERIQLSDFFANSTYQELFRLSCAVNGTAQLQQEDNPEKGSATEIAILKLLKKAGFDYSKIREQFASPRKYPFNSERKRMSTIINYQGKDIILLKGASEIVLDCCNRWMLGSTAEIRALDPTIQQEMKDSITKMAKRSLRTLCFAYKEVSDSDDLNASDAKGVFQIQKSGFVLLTIIGVKDIARQEVPEAIRKCKAAGITVRMVTGDNLITAKAIAEEIGIISPEDTQALVMEGTDFIERIGGVICKKCEVKKCDCPINTKEAEKRGLTSEDVRIDTIQNKEEFKLITDHLLVLARSRPEDKYALVTGLKENDNVVAVTGDGTNDAPALKKADVGFAMGINGTEVAKEASAIILLDDNFESIVKAVLWGRNIYDSIRKFVQFQLTVNVVAVGITLIGAALLKQEILKPIQMLWVNLIMDTLGSLALATEPPTESLLERKPHKRDDYIISPTMYKHILGQALFQITVLVFLVFWGEHIIPEYSDSFDSSSGFQSSYKYGADGMARSGRMLKINGKVDYEDIFEATKVYSRHSTFIFNTFVMMQIFNFINSRKIHDEKNVFAGLCNNILFLGIVSVIFLMQVILVTFAGSAFGVYSYFGLHPAQWAICILIGSFSLVVSFLLKLLPSDLFPAKGKAQGDYAHPKTRVTSWKRRESTVQRQLRHNRVE